MVLDRFMLTGVPGALSDTGRNPVEIDPAE
jgi:hypothetical protein